MDGVSSPVEARLQALLDALPDLLLRLRADGTYLEVAGDVSRLANPPNVVIGSRVGDLLPSEIAEQLMSCVRAALESGRLATVEYRLRTHLGEERDFEVRIAPASEDEVVAIVRDVTDLHDATRELKESRARLVAAGDAERRRVERNLHDGAQQRLVTVALHLQLIRRRLETDPSEVPILVEAAQNELTLALGDPGARPRLAPATARRPRARPRACGARRASRTPGGDRGHAIRPAARCRRSRGVLHHRGSPRERGEAQPRVARDRERVLGARRGRWSRSSTTASVGPIPMREPGCAASPTGSLPSVARSPSRVFPREAPPFVPSSRTTDSNRSARTRRSREETREPRGTRLGHIDPGRRWSWIGHPFRTARLVGIVFLLLGILGFIPGITTNLYDGLEFAGNDGNAELLGIFAVSVLHNIVHGLWASPAWRWRRPRAAPAHSCSAAARSTSCSGR